MGSAPVMFKGSGEVNVTDTQQAGRKELGGDINKVAKSHHGGSWRPWKGLCILSSVIWEMTGKQRNNLI